MKLEITYANNFGEWQEEICVNNGKADKVGYLHLPTYTVTGLEALSKVDHLNWVDLFREVRRHARQWSGPVNIKMNGVEMPQELYGLRRPPAEAVRNRDPRIPESGLVDTKTANDLFCDYGLGHVSEYSYFKKVG
jgi:hypothetical protein